MWYSVVDISLQNQYIAMLHSSIDIGIARGQYYWILGALFGIVLTLDLSIAIQAPAGYTQ